MESKIPIFGAIGAGVAAVIIVLFFTPSGISQG